MQGAPVRRKGKDRPRRRDGLFSVKGTEKREKSVKKLTQRHKNGKIKKFPEKIEKHDAKQLDRIFD